MKTFSKNKEKVSIFEPHLGVILEASASESTQGNGGWKCEGINMWPGYN